MRTCLLIAVLLVVGCGGETEPLNPPSRADSPANGGGSSGESEPMPAAIIGGRAVSWRRLRPMLAEAAGGRVLAEYVLDQRIRRRLRQRGLAVPEADVKREKQMLLDRMHDDANKAARLLRQFREERGLGSTRFTMLLRRNAGLRKLVADEVTVPDELVERLHERAYGEQVQIRLITVPTLKQADAVRRRLAGGELFSDIAVEVSTDASGARGGLLPPISRNATVLPDAVVKVAWSEPVGQVSDPIALEGGFALVRIERRIPAQDTPLAEVRDELRDLAREQQTQRRMQREARALMDAADVTVLDAALDEAWRRQRQALIEPAP